MCHRNIKPLEHSRKQQNLKLSNSCESAMNVFRSFYKLLHKTDI